MTTDQIHHFIAVGAIPFVVRLVSPVIKSTVDYVAHHWLHKGAHIAGHKVGIVGKAFKKIPFLMDAAIIAGLTVLSQIIESKGEHE
jgi:hypothetical protein